MWPVTLRMTAKWLKDHGCGKIPCPQVLEKHWRGIRFWLDDSKVSKRPEVSSDRQTERGEWSHLRLTDAQDRQVAIQGFEGLCLLQGIVSKPMSSKSTGVLEQPWCRKAFSG